MLSDKESNVSTKLLLTSNRYPFDNLFAFLTVQSHLQYHKTPKLTLFPASMLCMSSGLDPTRKMNVTRYASSAIRNERALIRQTMHGLSDLSEMHFRKGNRVYQVDVFH